MINILAADKLMNAPKLYSTLLLWLLSELFERLPEVGDPDKPKLVFFFDEAHLLFTDAPKPLLDKIEQVVRLIRSKGVGVYFVTQNPLDVPETVLGQLGNRVQHALRAFTPRDQKAVKAAAETLRANPKLDTEKAITRARRRRGAGLVPRREGPAGHRRARVRPAAGEPHRARSRRDERTRDDRGVAGRRRLRQRRSTANRRTSGCSGRAEQAAPAAGPPARGALAGGGFMDSIKGSLGGLMTGSGRKDSMVEAMAKSAARTVGSTVGREIVRGVLGSLLGGSKRR